MRGPIGCPAGGPKSSIGSLGSSCAYNEFGQYIIKFVPVFTPVDFPAIISYAEVLNEGRAVTINLIGDTAHINYWCFIFIFF